MYVVIYFIFRLFIGHSEKAFSLQSTFSRKWSVITIYCVRFFGISSRLIFIIHYVGWYIWLNNQFSRFTDDVS